MIEEWIRRHWGKKLTEGNLKTKAEMLKAEKRKRVRPRRGYRYRLSVICSRDESRSSAGADRASVTRAAGVSGRCREARNRARVTTCRSRRGVSESQRWSPGARAFLQKRE